MTDKTRDDLIAQALINLKVIGSGRGVALGVLAAFAGRMP